MARRPHTHPDDAAAEAPPLPDDGVPQTLPDPMFHVEQADAAADVAPEKPKRARVRAKKDDGPKRGPGRPSKTIVTAQLRDDLARTIDQLAGLLAIGAIANPKLAYDAQVIGTNSAALAAELVRQADRTPWLRRALEAVTGGADTARLVALVAGTALPIAANHGLLPAALVGLLVPGAPPIPTTDPDAAGADLLGMFSRLAANGAQD